jgi:hypothetical protein
MLSLALICSTIPQVLRRPKIIGTGCGLQSLTTLFPTSQGYIVTPQRRIPKDTESHISDFVIEVKKLIAPPFQFRTVLVKNSQHWQAGIPSLERQVKRQPDAAFSGTAVPKMYWIGVIGPHWLHGIKEEDDKEDPKPLTLIAWHDITRDQASYKWFARSNYSYCRSRHAKV